MGYDAIITPKSFDRKELHFNVVEASSSEKASVLAGIIRSDLPAKYRTTAGSFYQTRDSDTNCGIVFCPHTNGDYGVVKVADDIKARINIQTQCYSGKPPTGIGEDQWRGIKNKNAKGFKDNEFPLLVATNAFGMGIDKANIRFTVHYGMPASPEAFYQEAGRAGRDRKTSYCYLIISNDVPQRNSRLLDFSTPIEAIKNETDKTSFKDKDDIDRMMYFHLLAFGGTEEERRFADIVRRELDEVPRERKTTFNYGAMGKDAKGQLEKALHRFIILGIVRDYTVDYSAREVVAEFTTADNQAILHRYAEYVRGYNRGRVARETDKLKTWVDLPYREFATHAFAILLDFIYDTIERGRRRAMAEMLSISTQALQSKDKDGTVRARVLHYFETHHSAEIEEILTSPDAGFDLVQSIMIGAENEEGELLGGIRSPKDAAELRGEVSRSLESTPDHPGLLLLRALTESLCNDADPMIVNQNLRSAYSSALDRYGVSEDRMESLLVFTANILFDKRPDLYGPVINGILSMMRSNSYRSRLILEADFEEMLPEPMEHVMDDCVHQVMQIMKFKEE